MTGFAAHLNQPIGVCYAGQHFLVVGAHNTLIQAVKFHPIPVEAFHHHLPTDAPIHHLPVLAGNVGQIYLHNLSIATHSPPDMKNKLKIFSDLAPKHPIFAIFRRFPIGKAGWSSKPELLT
jgi:hypothetical protein